MNNIYAVFYFELSPTKLHVSIHIHTTLPNYHAYICNYISCQLPESYTRDIMLNYSFESKKKRISRVGWDLNRVDLNCLKIKQKYNIPVTLQTLLYNPEQLVF